MTPETITQVLNDLFSEAQVRYTNDKTWKVHKKEERFHLLISLSKEGDLLQAFVPIASQKDAEIYLPQLLESNFNENKLVRYALSQNLLWGAFKYPLESLEIECFHQALIELVELHQKQLNQFFDQLAEAKIREIVRAAKSQGQTLEQTMQTITRFYQEGVMGGLDQEPRQQRKALLAWQLQLEKLWQEES